MSNEKIGIIDKIKRLNRIAGQVEGIKKMVEDERGNTEVLTQLRAVRAAVKGMEIALLTLSSVSEASTAIVLAWCRRARGESAATVARPAAE